MEVFIKQEPELKIDDFALGSLEIDIKEETLLNTYEDIVLQEKAQSNVVDCELSSNTFKIKTENDNTKDSEYPANIEYCIENEPDYLNKQYETELHVNQIVQPMDIAVQSTSNESSQDSDNGSSTLRPKKSCTKKQNIAQQNAMLRSVCKLIINRKKSKEKKDVYFETTKKWAQKLRAVDREQMRYAEKAINDVLFEALSNTLHKDSIKINHSDKSQTFDQSRTKVKTRSSKINNTKSKQKSCVKR